MPLGFSAVFAGDDIRKTFEEQKRGIQKAVTSAVSRVGEALKNQLRSELKAAGVKDRPGRAKGQSLVNSWRSTSYPRGGRVSINAATLVSSGAPAIIEWLSAGPTIRAASGGYLVIPLPEAVKRNLDRRFLNRGAGFRLAKTADLGGALEQFGRLHRIPRKDGSIVLAVEKSTYRASGYRARGNKGDLVPLFLLVRQVKGRKRINPDATAEKFAALVPDAINAELDRIA